MSTYTTRPAGPAEEAALVELAQGVLGVHERTTAAYWRWKHSASPFGPSYVRCAFADEGPDASPALVGARLFMRWRFRANGETHEAVRAVDTATHPAWRRQGIFSRLSEELVEDAREAGAAFVFNTPNDASRGGNIRLGWEPVGNVPIVALPVRPARAALRIARARVGAPNPTFAFDEDGSVAALLADARLDGVLANAATDDGRLRTPVDAAFLRWRYLDIPDHVYRARWHFVGDEGGLVIARRRARGPLDETAIALLLATPGATGRRLARRALLDLCGESASDYVIASAAPRTIERAVLCAGLFAPAPQATGPMLVARPLVAGAPDPRRLDAWRGQIGDFELF